VSMNQHTFSIQVHGRRYPASLSLIPLKPARSAGSSGSQTCPSFQRGTAGSGVNTVSYVAKLRQANMYSNIEEIQTSSVFTAAVDRTAKSQERLAWR
jgi:hypothetical protein